MIIALVFLRTIFGLSFGCFHTFSCELKVDLNIFKDLVRNELFDSILELLPKELIDLWFSLKHPGGELFFEPTPALILKGLQKGRDELQLTAVALIFKSGNEGSTDHRVTVLVVLDLDLLSILLLFKFSLVGVHPFL